MADQTIRAVFAADDQGLLTAIRAVEQELAGLKRGVKEASAVTRENRGEVSQLARAYDDFGKVGAHTTGSISQGLIQLQQHANRGFTTFSTNISRVALNMVGLEGASGRVVESLLLLGAGGAATIAIAAGIAVLGAAYRGLTSDLRKARDEANKLDEQLERTAASGAPERIQLAQERAKLQADLDKVKANLTGNVQQITAEKVAAGFSVAEIINLFTGDVKKDVETYVRTTKAIEQLDKQIADARVRDLAKLRDLGVARPDQLELLKTLRAQYQARLASARTEEEQIRYGSVLKDTAEGEAKAKEKTTKEDREQLTLEQQRAAEALRAAARQRLEEADRARRGLGTDSILTRTGVNGQELFPFDPKADPLQKAGEDLFKRPSPIIQQIGKVDIAALSDLSDQVTAEWDAKWQQMGKTFSKTVVDTFALVQDQATAAFDNIFSALILGGRTAGEVLLSIFQNVALSIGHMLAEQAGTKLAAAISGVKPGSDVGATKLALAGAAVATGGAAVSHGATELLAGAAATTGAAIALGQAADKMLAAALISAGVGGFAEGGWTGPGAKFRIAGVVHADEFVVQKSSRQQIERRWPGALDYMNQFGRLPGYAMGGAVLSPGDLRDALTFTAPISPEAFARQAVSTSSPNATGLERPAPDSSHRLEIGLDDGLILRKLESSAGKRALVRVFDQNRDALKAALGLTGG